MDRRARWSALSLATCALLAGCGVATLPPASSASSGRTPAFSHVFLIVMENREYGDVIGNGAAPYINTLAQAYGLATAYYAISHPSLPNYLSLLGGDTFGVTSDCTDCFVPNANLVDALESGHKTWRAYMEGMPSACYVGDAYPYMQKHDPFIYFDNIRTNAGRCANVVPLSNLSNDLANGQVRDFSWITPDMCHDMHDCTTQAGDAWLSTFVPTILASRAWKNGGALFITWDEGTTSDGCCGGAAGGHVVTVVLSPLGKAGYRSSIPHDHYDLLRTIADGLGVAAPGRAAQGTPMSEYFTGS
jgi:hypothetical protein